MLEVGIGFRKIARQVEIDITTIIRYWIGLDRGRQLPSEKRFDRPRMMTE